MGPYIFTGEDHLLEVLKDPIRWLEFNRIWWTNDGGILSESNPEKAKRLMLDYLIKYDLIQFKVQPLMYNDNTVKKEKELVKV